MREIEREKERERERERERVCVVKMSISMRLTDKPRILLVVNLPINFCFINV